MKPAIRASQLLAKLGIVDAKGRDFASEIYHAMGQKDLLAIRESSRLAWLDLRYDEVLSRAIFHVHGEDGSRAVSCGSMLASLNGPLLGPIASSAIRLFGIDPARFFKLVPKGWGLVYRDVGRVEVTTRGDGATIIFEGAPASFFSEGYLEGVAGGLDAILKFRDVPGSVKVASRNKARSVIHLEANWVLS